MVSAATSSHSGDRLSLLYRLSQSFNSSLDLNEVLNRVIDETIEILHAERGFVLLFDPDGSQTFSVARGLDRKTIDQPQFHVSQSVIKKVSVEGQPILTSDAQADKRFNMRESVMLLGLRSILCVPLKVKDIIKGVIYADNRFEVGIFTQADLELLNAIASIGAISVENAMLYQMAVEKGRMQRELQMARDIQVNFLPQDTPHLDNWDFAIRWEPAREVAGDYFDFVPVGARSLGLVIADVTDKGAPAALFMVFTNSIIRASLHPDMPPAESIANANRLITSKSPNAMFVSVIYILLDPDTGFATYVNAGHNPPLFLRSRDHQLLHLTRTGMVLGIDADTPFFQRSIDIEQDDILLLYTDGLTDTINPAGQPFGLERLEEVLLQNSHRSAQEIADQVINQLMIFSDNTPPFDDVTLLLVKRQ